MFVDIGLPEMQRKNKTNAAVRAGVFNKPWLPGVRWQQPPMQPWPRASGGCFAATGQGVVTRSSMPVRQR
jgi:hypothetical protein